MREPDARTRDAQHRASDPMHSAWVSAHAGSGKTHVLASRVVRLLLEGVPPARILCVTFTKAAAANMAARIFDALGKWAVADDDRLRALLAQTGAPATVSLDLARKLFARAVETPGGLKIQTIHAFCERVLHLFPFEANVAADFRVIEEADQAELLEAARKAALVEMRERDDASRAALTLVAEGTWDGGFIELVNEMLKIRHRSEGSLQERTARLRDALGLAPDETKEPIRASILDGGIQRREWPAIADRLARGSQTDQDRATKLREAAGLPDDDATLAYLALFRTKNGWQKSMCTKGLRDADANLNARLESEAARLPPLREKWLALHIVARTAALETVCGAVIAHYEREKQRRALLDFDDLIARTNELLTHAHVSDWVLFKLDGGIDHILVDEAQDTSEPQWRILEALAREFTAGEGRSRAHRTFFAVGDEKQSIFSFQGAAPAMFDKMKRTFDARTRGAGRRFADVLLRLSFRSSPDVLHAVDAVFADEARRRGLSSDSAAPVHDALKRDLPGLVEIWPLLAATERAPPESWLLPLDVAGEHEPPAKLARKIAKKISQLLDLQNREAVEGATPGSRRPITPGDIMVLVRRRDAFFEAVIRALKDLDVRVAGADRLDVVGHIAAMDCAAAGRVALLPDDDLSLATVLKSPLIGLDDDDLIALAPRRPGSLHAVLLHSPEPRHRDAAARIARWREMAPHVGPFDFFSRILGAEGGRRDLLSRLGAEANDALDEFLALALAQERTGAPSLLAFLTLLETLKLDVKRDLEAANDMVRVMTVHAAKGLEAKIVFLPDTCAAPAGHFDPTIYALDTGAGRTLAWSANMANDPAPLVMARAAARRAQDDEYRRLLYVAMTRAEERLYIAGYYNKIKPRPDCWHAMILAALQPIGIMRTGASDDDGETWRYGEGLSLDTPAVQSREPHVVELPRWLTEHAREEPGPAPAMRPSYALAEADRRDGGIDRAVATRARARGIAMHELLRRLPDVAPAMRSGHAKAMLGAWPELAGEHDTIVDAALAVIAEPVLAPLFAKGALAEVAIEATVARAGRAPVNLSGQIDRLAETADAILVADFKTGDVRADGPADAHVAQLALYAAALRQLYPGRDVRPSLVYTAGPTVVALDDETLDAALTRALDAAG